MAKKKRDRNKSAGKRNAAGRFESGNPGGPGRPRGLRNKATQLIEELLDGEAESLVRALVRRAKAGNGTALNIVFARLAPPRRDRPITLALPRIESVADLLAAHAAIIAAVGEGELSPSEAQAMTTVLDHHRRATEAVRFEERLAAIEARLVAQNEKIT